MSTSVYKLFATALSIMAVAACTASEAKSDCAGLTAPCFAASGVAVLAEADAAKEILAVAESGAKKFKTHFQEDASPIVIVPGGKISNELSMQIEAAGFPAALPWVSESEKAKLTLESVKRQIEAQTKNLPPAVREKAMKQAIAQLSQQPMSTSMDAHQKGALAHELGHMWFMGEFTPKDKSRDTGHGYGGWGPDWLDETAAILMENDVLTQSRREAFAELSDDVVIPLSTFFTMEHPVMEAANALKDKITKDPETSAQAIILTGDEAADFFDSIDGDDPVVFYSQVRVFADFMIETTKDEAVFARVAALISKGGTIEDWLASGASNLPENVQALQGRWDSWRKAR